MGQGHFQFVCSITLALTACGSHDGDATSRPTHTVRPEPPAHAATPTVPSTGPATTPSTGPATPTPTTPTTPAPNAATAFPVAAEPAAPHFHLTVDVVTLPDAARSTALATRIKADAREMLVEDGNVAPRDFDGSCVLTLALADVASYACTYNATVFGDREDMDVGGHAAFTYVFDGATLHATEPEDWLVLGADTFVLADDACRDADAAAARADHRPPLGDEDACGADDATFALSPTGLEVAWGGGADWGADESISQAHIDYAALGKLMKRDSVLAKIAGALDHANAETDLWRDAAPPPEGATVHALGGDGPLDGLATTWGRAAPVGVQLMVVDASNDEFEAYLVTREAPATAAHALGDVAITEQPLALPFLRLSEQRLRRAMPLRAAPRAGAPQHGTLPAGAEVVGVVGPVGGNDSDLGAGLWTYVSVDDANGGWVPSGTLQRRAFEPPTVVASFLALVPDAERDHARQALRRVAMRSADGQTIIAVFAANAVATRTWIRLSQTSYSGEDARTVVSATVDGLVTDVRPTVTASARGQQLVLVALDRGQPGGVEQWQAYALGAGADAAPVLDVALPTAASLRRAQRAQLRVAVTRAGQFYPLVVHGPGNVETPYTWSQAALVAVPPPAPTAP